MYENACPVLLGQWAAMNNSRVQVTAIIPAQPQWEEATKPKKKLDFLEIQMQTVQITNSKKKAYKFFQAMIFIVQEKGRQACTPALTSPRFGLFRTFYDVPFPPLLLSSYLEKQNHPHMQFNILIEVQSEKKII